MIQCAVLLAGMLVGGGQADEGISNLPARISANSEEPRYNASVPATPREIPQAPSIPTAGAAKEPAAPQSRERVVRRITPRSHDARFGKGKSLREGESEVGADSEKKKEDDKAQAPPSSRRMTWWVTTALGLIVVLAVIFAAGRALRSVVPGMGGLEMSGPIHVLHRTFITPKQSACLIRCGDRILLIGLSGDRMQTLAEITDPKEIDFLKGACMQIRPRSTTQAFRDIFRKGNERWSENDEAEERRDSSRSTGPAFASAERPDKPTSREVGEFAKQLQSVRDRLFARKAGAEP